jgi:hypothetical protein
LEEARRYAKTALRDLTEDVRQYLDILERLEAAGEGSDAYEELEPRLAVAVTAMRIHAEDVEEAMDAITDALPDDTPAGTPSRATKGSAPAGLPMVAVGAQAGK